MNFPSKSHFALLALTALALFPHQAEAQTSTWGGSNGSWNVGANWTSGTVPGSGTSVLIDSGTANLPASFSGTISSLTVGNENTGELVISGGTLTTTSISVGVFNTGVVMINGGELLDQESIDMSVGTFGNGSVTVSSGTWEMDGSLILGGVGTGSLTVNGGNVDVANTFLYVGLSGSGTLTISSGSVSGDQETQFGANAGSNGTGVVSGGTLNASTSIFVGTSGTGSLLVDGGYVTTQNGAIGNAQGSIGTTTITSGTWANSGSFIVGDQGAGVLNLQGGVVTSGTAGAFVGYTNVVGPPAGGSGTANVTSGSWINAGNLTVGIDSGTGTLNVNGGYISDVNGIIGTGTSYQGSIGGLDLATVTSGTWANSSTLMVGGTWSTGALLVNGGYLSGSNGIIDSGSGQAVATGTVSSGTWMNSGSLIVGNSGSGAMVINGGYVSANITTLGLNAGSSGAVTIGSGTLSTTDLLVGESGTASLLVNGGYVTSGFGAVGDGNTYATATVTGGTWATIGLDLGIGNSQATSGTGVLDVNGGVVTTGSNAFIGTSPYGSGMLTVTSGSFLVSSGSLHVYGYDGPSSLTVNGGYVSDPSADSQASGTVNVSSGTWATTGQLYLNSTMFNFSGGLVSDGGATVQSSGTLSGGSWTNSGVFQVDQFGNTSTFAMTGGALTSVYSQVGQGNYATATITGGTWTSGSMTVGGIDGVLNISGSGVVNIGNGSGTLALAVNPTDVGTLNIGTGGAAGTLLAAGVSGGSGTATVNFDSTGTNTFTPLISGNITVNQTGAGDTVLTGSNTYTGTTTVSRGTLTVNGAITNSPAVVNGGVLNGSGTTGNVTVNNGGALQGMLTSQSVTVNTGGTLSPGDGPGSDVMSNLVMSGSATYHAQIAVPASGSFAAGFPTPGTEYSQTTLTGTGAASGQTVLTLGTGSILQLTVTGTLPAAGMASQANPYNPSGSNNLLDNYFIFHSGNSTYEISGTFTQATVDGTNLVNINYSNTNLVDNSNDGTFTLDGQEWVISYTGDEADNSTTGGNDVVLTAAVPALPQPWLAMPAIGAAGMVMLARRTRRKFP